MTRLYDKVCREIKPRLYWDGDYMLYEELKESPVISAENVAEYWQSLPHEKRYPDLRDYPDTFHCVAPIFNSFWIESKITLNEHVRSFGWWVHSQPMDLFPDSLKQYGERWMVTADFFADVVGEPTITFEGKSRDDGLPPSIGQSKASIVLYVLPDGTLAHPPSIESEYKRELFRMEENLYTQLLEYGEYIQILLLTLAFIHTKNTELIDHHPPSKLSKKHEKKYGEPLVTYKTIKVNPMRTVQRMDGDDVPSSERDTTSKELMPLHIVAGNFADYRDGPGLFGKPELKAVFWRPQHVRGTAKRGVVVKDYEVEAPDDDESDVA